MKKDNILTITIFIALFFVAMLFLLNDSALSDDGDEEPYPHYPDNEKRYMELHLKSYGNDNYLTPKIEKADERNERHVVVDKKSKYPPYAGGNWHEIGRWYSKDLLKDITASRSRDSENYSEEFSLSMVIWAQSDAEDGSTDRVSIRVKILPFLQDWIEDPNSPKSLNSDQPTKFYFDFEFNDVQCFKGSNITIIIEAKSEENYDPATEDQNEEIHIIYGDLNHDTYINFEANCVTMRVNTNENNEVEIEKYNGLAYLNVTFIHAFGRELINQDRTPWYYLRIRGPANESQFDATNWTNTISWNETSRYLRVGDLTSQDENIFVPIKWQIQESVKDPSIRAQYAPVNRTYFMYFKGWDIYPQNNNTPWVMNDTFKVPRFPNATERVELEWLTDNVFFYNEKGRRFYPTDEQSKGIAVGDNIYVVSNFIIGGGASPDKYYDRIEIKATIRDPQGEEIYSVIVEGNYRGETSNIFKTPEAWVPEKAGEGYVVNLTLNPSRNWKEYNYTNNYLEISFNVYENRRPVAIISSPVPTVEDDPNTYAQIGEDIHFDATESYDPDTSYAYLDFLWEIDDFHTVTTREMDEFFLQLPAGEYKVTLTVSDGVREDSTSLYFKVNSPPKPTSGSNGIVEPEDGASFSREEVIRFTALYTDPDADTLYYTWRSDVKGVLGEAESTLNYVEVSGLQAGQHNISVTVKDKHGGVHVSEIVIYVNNLPVVIVESPEDGKYYGSGDDIVFDASASFDVEDGVGDNLNYIWYYDDGSGYIPFGYESVTTRSFHNAGEYHIKVEVYDSMGGMSEKEITININAKPVAKIEIEKKDGKKITFDGSNSYDPDNKGIDRYIWDFDTTYDSDGDGIPNNDRDGEGVKPTYEFNRTGTFNISLVVVDMDGVWSEPVYMDVEVKEKDEGISLSPAVAVIAFSLSTLMFALRKRK